MARKKSSRIEELHRELCGAHKGRKNPLGVPEQIRREKKIAKKVGIQGR